MVISVAIMNIDIGIFSKSYKTYKQCIIICRELLENVEYTDRKQI